MILARDLIPESKGEEMASHYSGANVEIKSAISRIFSDQSINSFFFL